MAQKQPSVLSFRGFRNLWLGQVVSQFGDTLYVLVFLWLVLDITGSEGAVGIVMAFAAAPYVLLSWYAGALADRIDRRTILIASDILSAVLVFGFAGLMLIDARPPLAAICVIAFLLGCANVFAAPARNASVPRLVPPDRLLEANSLNAGAQSAMPLVSAGLSAGILGVLFRLNATLAYFLSFLFNGITFLVSAVFMWKLPNIVPERSAAPKHPMREAVDGIRLVMRHDVLRVAVLMAVGMNFFIAPFMPAYVVVAQDKFQGTPGLLAFLEMWFFLGMLGGSWLAFRSKIKRPGIAFSGFLFIAALPIVPMGLTNSIAVFSALNFVCGIFIPLASIPMNTLIQLATPDEFRGRVNAALGMMAAMVMPVGYAMSGFLIGLMGLEGIFIFMGIGFASSGLVGLLFRAFRNSTLPTSSEPADAAEASSNHPSAGDGDEVEMPATTG